MTDRKKPTVDPKTTLPAPEAPASEERPTPTAGMKRVRFPGPGDRILHEPPHEIHLQAGKDTLVPEELVERLVKDLGCTEVA